ncbi:hypothetical protein [Streptomyces sp. NPDC002932]|uniref:hypothetical protein n=1 Tax=Streptomyces sp. NPDC002932 TaxID=3364672 RepID=UPI0036CA732F
MPTSESDLRPPRAVTMTELLAAGAAASAVSTPPDDVSPGADECAPGASGPAPVCGTPSVSGDSSPSGD